MRTIRNPTLEDQALARIHRIGQTKEVTTVRFIVRDSFEEVRNEDSCTSNTSCKYLPTWVPVYSLILIYREW